MSYVVRLRPEAEERHSALLRGRLQQLQTVLIDLGRPLPEDVMDADGLVEHSVNAANREVRIGA